MLVFPAGVPVFVVMAALYIRHKMQSPRKERLHALAKLCRAAAGEAGAQVLWISEKTGVEFSGGALIVYPPMGADRNDGLAILASVGEYDMLVTGDCDMRSEQALLEQYSLPQVELLVAGHHGAAESTSQALLRWVQPETVVISVGAENHYGHPDQETLARIEAAGAAVFRTDQDGTLFFRR